MTDEFEQRYIFDGEEKSKLELKLSNFDGPLDLLLELVKQNKIEIKDIFISQVTEQFLQYIDQISDLDVDQAGEYMAMAATLLEIKAKQCIPVLATDIDDDSPEKVLIRQLEEYKVFKEVVTDLKEQENVNRFYREPDKSVGKSVTVIKDNLSVEGFMEAFSKFLMKMQLKNQVENVSRTMQRETFSVAQKVRLLLEILKEEDSFMFSRLFDENVSLNEYITTFLAVLELLKQQVIDVKQKDLFEDILIEKRPDSDNIVVVVEDEYESVE